MLKILIYIIFFLNKRHKNVVYHLMKILIKETTMVYRILKLTKKMDLEEQRLHNF